MFILNSLHKAFGLGAGDIIIIIVVILMVFGVGNLSKILHRDREKSAGVEQKGNNISHPHP